MTSSRCFTSTSYFTLRSTQVQFCEFLVLISAIVSLHPRLHPTASIFQVRRLHDCLPTFQVPSLPLIIPTPILATSQTAKRQKIREAARKHQAKRVRPSNVDHSDKGSDKQAEAEKDPTKDPAKDPAKDPVKDPEKTSVGGGWRPRVSKEFIMKRLDKDQPAAAKMQVSLVWAILRTPEADEDAWEANQTFAETICRESGITTATQGRNRFWTTCDDIFAQPIWEELCDLYAIGNRSHDGTLEAIGSFDERCGEHYVWYAILTIINNWASKRKEREVNRHKRVLEDPETPRSATRTRVFPPVQHSTPIVSPSRAANPDNELQAELLWLTEDTLAHPTAATFADWVIQGGCKDIRWGICLLPMPMMVSLSDAIRVIDVCEDASLFGCLGPYRGDPTVIHEHNGTLLVHTKNIHAWLRVTAGENVASPVVLVLEPNSRISSWFNGYPSHVVTVSGSPVSTRAKARCTDKTPPPSQAAVLKRRTIATALPSPGDNSCAVSRQLDDEEYRSEDEGGREIDDDIDADDEYFEADDHVLVMMANKIAQVHVILEEPVLPAHRIPGLICDSWDKAVHTTGLKDVGLKLCGGVDYMHSDCHPYKVIRQAISNAVGNFRKMVKSNLPTEQYFDFAKLDEK
ncbi:hypothetical protein K440DRAFT_636862 [Wilcoxina mikolae CBS 423.85]|nr:hypothetical protein K440DRAFT_636862 [Wilcoxina mikolae CBS 423.85]